MSVKYETIQQALRCYRKRLWLINEDTPSGKKEKEYLENEILTLEEMADKIESRARDIQMEMGV